MADILNFNKYKGATIEQMHEEFSKELSKVLTPKMAHMLLAVCVMTGELPILKIIKDGRAAEVLTVVAATNEACLAWLKTLGVDWKVIAQQIQTKYGMEDDEFNDLLNEFTTTTIQ